MIDALSAGADDFMPKPCDPGELQARLAVAHRIIGLQSALRDAACRLEKLAHLDPLMAVGNRLAFMDYVPELHAAADRSGRGYAVLLCDVDRFKTCNDRFGHAFGDEVLRRIARSLTEALRPGDRIFRYGGEEILVIAPGTELAQAIEVAEDLRKRVSELDFSMEAAADPFRTTISIGVCCYDPLDPKGTWEEINGYADRALYEAKHSGRDCVVAAAPQSDGSARFHLTKPQIDYSYMKAVFRD
jgi:diguanylate cyclase (GGDEF)-like protein